jgi:hypothetical protein
MSLAEVSKEAAHWLGVVASKVPGMPFPTVPVPTPPSNPVPASPSDAAWLQLIAGGLVMTSYNSLEGIRQRTIDAASVINYNGAYDPMVQWAAYVSSGIILDASRLDLDVFDPVDALRGVHSPAQPYNPSLGVEVNSGSGLESVSPNVRNAFGSDAKITTLTEDTTVYRYYSDKSQASGKWFTPNQVVNPNAELALPPRNTAQYMDVVVLPAGTRVIEGTVAPQKNWMQPGGGYQYYVLP